MYTLESNISKGSKDVVVYKSDGKRRKDSQLHVQPAPAIQIDPLSGTDVELGLFQDEEITNILPQATPSRQRLSVCTCYICHEQIGALSTARMGNLWGERKINPVL